MHPRAAARRDHECQRIGLAGERHDEPQHLMRQRLQRELGLDHHTQRAFTAHEPLHRVMRDGVAHGVLLELRTAQFELRPVCEQHGERAHVRAGGAVAEAARAARIAGDGATDGAFLLARGIGREQHALRFGGAAHVGYDGAGADAHGAPVGVDLVNGAEVAEREQDAPVGDEGALGGGLLQDLAQFLDGARARDGVGDQFETRSVARMRKAHVVVEGEVRH